MKNKTPKKGQIWKQKDKKYFVLITDVATKRKNDLRMYDDDWNDAKIGQKFVYTINKHTYDGAKITHQGRGKIEDFLELFEFYKQAYKCTCPKCNEYHINWSHLYEM